jgi:hypothetical protein
VIQERHQEVDAHSGIVRSRLLPPDPPVAGRLLGRVDGDTVVELEDLSIVAALGLLPGRITVSWA